MAKMSWRTTFDIAPYRREQQEVNNDDLHTENASSLRRPDRCGLVRPGEETTSKVAPSAFVE